MNRQSVDAPQGLSRALIQIMLVRLNLGRIELLVPTNGSAKPDRFQNRRRAGLKLVGRFIIRDPVHAYRLDHLATTLIRPRVCKRVSCSVQDADASRTIQLVPRENVPVTSQRLNIDAEVHGGLATIHKNACADFMRDATHFSDIVHRSQHIAHMADRDHARLRPDSRAQTVHVERAIIVQANPSQHSTLPFTQKMPRHDVGMVLHDGQHDFIPGLNCFCQCGCDQVDPLGCTLREDDIVHTRRIQEITRGFTPGLVGLGRLVRQRMNPPVDVRI